MTTLWVLRWLVSGWGVVVAIAVGVIAIRRPSDRRFRWGELWEPPAFENSSRTFLLLMAGIALAVSIVVWWVVGLSIHEKRFGERPVCGDSETPGSVHGRRLGDGRTEP